MSTTITSITIPESKKKKKESKHKHHHSHKKPSVTPTEQASSPTISSSSSSSSEDDTILLCTTTPRGYPSPRYPPNSNTNNTNNNVTIQQQQQQFRHNNNNLYSNSIKSGNSSNNNSGSSGSDNDSDDDDNWSVNSGNTRRSTGSSSIASIHSYRSAWSSRSGNRMSPRGVTTRPVSVLGSPLMTSMVQFDAGSDDSGSRSSTSARRDWRKVPSKILGDDEVEKKAILVDFDSSVYDVRKMKESEREGLEKGKTYALKVNKTVKKFVTLVAKKENIGNPELFELFDPANSVILNDDMPLYMYYTKEALASKHRRRFVLRVATEDGLIASSSSSSSSSSSYYSDSNSLSPSSSSSSSSDYNDSDSDSNRRRRHHHHHHHHSRHHSHKKDRDSKGGKKGSGKVTPRKVGTQKGKDKTGEKTPLVRDRRSSAPSSQRPIIQATTSPQVNVSTTATTSPTPRRHHHQHQQQQQTQQSQQQQQQQSGIAGSQYAKTHPSVMSNGMTSSASMSPNVPTPGITISGSSTPTKSKSKPLSEEDRARKALLPPKLLDPIMPSLVWDEDFEVGRKVHPPKETQPCTSPLSSATTIAPQSAYTPSSAIRELLVTIPPRSRGPFTAPIPAIIVRNTARASPCGRRAIVWCHGATETLETCYPEIQRAAARHQKLDILAPEYKGFGIRSKTAGEWHSHTYHSNAHKKAPTVPEMLDELACTLKHVSEAWGRPYVLYGRGLGAELALFFATKLFFVGGGSKTGAGRSMLDGVAEKAKRALAVLVMEDPVLSPEFCNAVEFYGDCVECSVVIAVNAKEYSKNVLKRVVGEFKHVSLHHKSGNVQADRDAVIDEALALAAKMEMSMVSPMSPPMTPLGGDSTKMVVAVAGGDIGIGSGGVGSKENENGYYELNESMNRLSTIFGSIQQKGSGGNPATSKDNDLSGKKSLLADVSSASMMREWFRRRGYDAWLAETILRAGPRSLRDLADLRPSQAQLAEFPFLERVAKEARLSVAKGQVSWKLAKKSLAGNVTKVRSPRNRSKRVEITEPPKSWNILVVIKQTK